MLLTLSKSRQVARRLPGFSAVTLMLVVGACTDPTTPFSYSGLAPPPASVGQKTGGEAAKFQTLAAAHRANPADAASALAYAKVLRTGGSKVEALAVLDTTGKAKPADHRIALERGLLALELGDTAKAETLLRSVHNAKAPDWHLHSALGAALASRGKQQEAQAEFTKALALAPNHPSILNNLAISYALDGKAGEAEKILRTAATAKANPESGKVKQNLALVLGLGGKYAEARTVAEAAIPADKAKANVAYLQKLAAARTSAWTPTTQPADADPMPKAASADLTPPTYRLGVRPEAEK